MATLAIRPVAADETEGSGVLTESEGRKLFEMTAQRYLGMSGDQFLQMWDAGEFNNPEIRNRALRVADLIPLVRYVRAGKKTR